jgi:hypothetical protein
MMTGVVVDLVDNTPYATRVVFCRQLANERELLRVVALAEVPPSIRELIGEGMKPLGAGHITAF